MLRRLITLFALLSGLAAIGAPVQARALEVPGIGMVASAELTTRCSKQAVARLDERKQPATECRQEQKKGTKPAPSIIYFPPVMLQVDRARE
ncbi:hypothetical protein GRI89_11130 [Altererythrobacter salegens]|uniref:Ribosomal protein S27 n=1 Tax=Croceibacterium salegens TaxID=1737568 RepID=A0A6I4SVU4_9SPHN|nr:hypothetical protein [Croceibacterium salegens]MXO60091.1 hypothetical protein [Croceibacterium salegens]